MKHVSILFPKAGGTIAPEIYGHFSEHIGGVHVFHGRNPGIETNGIEADRLECTDVMAVIRCFTHRMDSDRLIAMFTRAAEIIRPQKFRSRHNKTDHQEAAVARAICKETRSPFFKIRKDNHFLPAARGIRTGAGLRKHRWQQSWKD